jgi:hypothetical protein
VGRLGPHTPENRPSQEEGYVAWLPEGERRLIFYAVSGQLTHLQDKR